ncbi:MAG: hypothetical protein Q4D98_12095 [Planctomycetia bacterium]|nr:hypothetical protein [Planctomycetia bacterium]
MHEILIQLGTTAVLFAAVIGTMWGVGHVLKKMSVPHQSDDLIE